MGNGLLFAAPEPSYHPLEYQGEFLWVPRVQQTSEPNLGQRIPCLLLQSPGAARLLIYFHANAEDLGLIYLHLRYLRTLLKVHVLALDYPGYGVCSGIPSEEKLLADAETVLCFVRDQLEVPVDRLIFMGRSLGASPAIFLASRHPCAGLVTVSAFASITAVVGSFPRLIGWLVDVLDNSTRIRSVQSPTLILHGKEDRLVDVGQASALASNCGADVKDKPRVLLNICNGVGHDNMDVKRDIIQGVQEAFPNLQEGEAISLASADRFLHAQPLYLAADVAARVPYSADWVPHLPPWPSIKITGVDGDEI